MRHDFARFYSEKLQDIYRIDAIREKMISIADISNRSSRKQSGTTAMPSCAA